MKKLKRVFGSVANLSSSRDDPSASNPPVPLSSSRKSISGSVPGLSDHRGSYVSYESQSLDSYNSTTSAEVDPYSKHDKTFTKLHKWAYLGDISKLKKFIKKIPVNSQDGEGKTPLHHAAAHGRGDAVLFLLGSKGNVEIKDNSGMTPFLRAVERCQISIIQMLIQRKVDIQATDNHGNNSIHIASKTGAVELLALLLDCGGDCDAQNTLGRAPLHLACSEDQQEIADTLLRHGASINIIDKESVTPLMMAAKVGSAPLVETLIENGVDVTRIDASRWSAADYAKFTNHNQLHHRLSSLLKDSGTSNLFSNDLLNVSDEGSSHEEAGAVGFSPIHRESDSEGAIDSWSDTSAVNSVKEKPKLNLTKFLPSSDESADNVISDVTKTSTSLGPPKPPRLYTSSSSLASVAAEDKEDDLNDKKSNTHEDDEEKDSNADDSWKSSSEDEPKLKGFSLFRKSSDNLGESKDEARSDKSIKTSNENVKEQSQSRIKKDDLMGELGLDDMKYHSSDDDDVSFNEEDAMLPIEEDTNPVPTSRRTSQGVSSPGLEKFPLAVKPSDKPDSALVSSPLVSSRSSFMDKEKSNLDLMAKSSPTSSVGSSRRTPIKLSPRKSPSKRSPKKTKERKSSLFDSDSEEEVVPLRRARRKSSTPSKKNLKQDPTSEYDITDEENCQNSNTIKPQTQKDSSSESTSIKDKANDKMHSKFSISSERKLSIASGHLDLDHTNTMSTVIGTLGREGTMQELEEMWEANPSISPKRSSSSSSIQNSEEHPDFILDEQKRKPSILEKNEKDVFDIVNLKKEKDDQSPHETGNNIVEQGIVKDSCKDSSLLISGPPSKADILSLEDNKNGKSNDIISTKKSLIEDESSPEVKPRNDEKEKPDSMKIRHETVRKRSGKNIISDIAKSHSLVSSTPSRKGSRSGTTRTSGFGSIVFSDEDFSLQDPLTTNPMEEIDDAISAASTETEESTHINSGLKDSLLTPLSSLPDAADIGQLQDLIRELRLKLEKEVGRRASIETKYSLLHQQQKHLRQRSEQVEEDVLRLRQENTSLTSRIKHLDYLGQCEQDSSRLKDQSLEDFHDRCSELEEECSSLRTHALQQEQLVDSLMAQLQTKERVNQNLQCRLEDLSSHTKYVSMKSCQTEEVLPIMEPGSQRSDCVDIQVQTVEEEFPEKLTPFDQYDYPERGEQCSKCLDLEKSICDTAHSSAQTEKEMETKRDVPIRVDVSTQIESLSKSNSSIGVQFSPDKAVKICQTQNTTRSNSSQTDATNNDRKLQERIFIDSSIQVCSVGKVAAVQTEGMGVEDKIESVIVQKVQSISADEMASALEPLLHNFSQDVKSLVVESVEANQTLVQDLMTKIVANQIDSLKGRMDDSLQQTSIKQSQDAELKFDELSNDLKEILQHQVNSVVDVFTNSVSSNNSNINDILAHIDTNTESSLHSIIQLMEDLQKTKGNNKRELKIQMENIVKDIETSNKKVVQSLTDFHKESGNTTVEVCDQFNALTLPQFSGIQKAIENLNHLDDSGLSEDQSKGIISRLDSLEKSLIQSFEKNPTSQDLSCIENELHKVNDGIHNKLSALQNNVQKTGSSRAIEQDVMDSLMDTIKDGNKQLLHVLKSKTSESATNINEVLEENFHILQDNLRKVQQSLVQRINEVSQNVNVSEEQKISWIIKQVSDMSNQISGMQTNILRMEASLEAAQNLPSTGGVIDESLISSLRVGNEQAVSSLKFQNQSMIELLESLQKEIVKISHRSQVSKEKTENYKLKETLMEKEEELLRLRSAQESLQEKLRLQMTNADQSQQKEQQLRLKLDSLLEKLHRTEEELKGKDARLSEEMSRNNHQTEDVTKIRQENYRLSTENSKLASSLKVEEQQKHWYMSELQNQGDAKERAELRLQDVLNQLQMTQQQLKQIPLQRTPPTGREKDDDISMQLQIEIKKLETEKKEWENLNTEHCNRVQHLEIQFKEKEAELGLEKAAKQDLEKHLKKTRETIENLQRNLSESSVEFLKLEDLQNSNAELEVALKTDEITIENLRKKIESINKEKLQLKQDVMLLKGEKLSIELLKQERDMAEEMQKKIESQLLILQRQISEEYIPKSKLNNLQKEIEHKYQLQLSAKISELNQLIEDQNQHQVSQSKVNESHEHGMKNEIERLSEEVVRLRALLNIHEEEKDSWKVRHDRLMNLYQHQAQAPHTSLQKPSYSRKSDEDLSIQLREINAHLKTPLASSTLLGQLNPPPSMQPPKMPSNIDSYHYTHSDSLDRTLQKYIKAAENNHSRYLSSPNDKTPDRISPIQPTRLFRETVPTLDKSYEAYVDVLNKKYGL